MPVPKTAPSSFWKARSPGWALHSEVSIDPDSGRIVKTRNGLLATSVLVPGLKVTVQFAKRNVVSTLIAQRLGAHQHRSKNGLVEWFQIHVLG